MKKISGHIFLLIIFIPFLFGDVNAQKVVSGFKGKRTIIGVNLPVALSPVNAGIARGIGFDIERVTQNYVSFNYSYKNFNDYINMSAASKSPYYLDENTMERVFYDPGGNFNMKRQEHKLSFKFYSKRKGSLAPMGAYWNLGLSFDVNKVDASSAYASDFRDSRGPDNIEYFNIVPHVSHGHKYLIAKNIFFDFELLFRFSAVELFHIDMEPFADPLPLETTMLYGVKKANFVHSLFQLNFGVKYAL